MSSKFKMFEGKDQKRCCIISTSAFPKQSLSPSHAKSKRVLAQQTRSLENGVMKGVQHVQNACYIPKTVHCWRDPHLSSRCMQPPARYNEHTKWWHTVRGCLCSLQTCFGHFCALFWGVQEKQWVLFPCQREPITWTKRSRCVNWNAIRSSVIDFYHKVIIAVDCKTFLTVADNILWQTQNTARNVLSELDNNLRANLGLESTDFNQINVFFNVPRVYLTPFTAVMSLENDY